ncbi:hypothetical protein ACFPMF_24300 [Larkinella bovis]|uniref:Outer membrane protein beta-barrel domain-containing protein n=1 Tax=Larkinella bovis TaxID=683041 RepID=A0ABW0IG49_9BACT
MKRIIFFSVLLVTFLFGGSRVYPQAVRGHLVYFQMGYLNAPQAGPVAQTFAPDWFPRLNDHFIYSGGEGWLRFNRLMAGLAATALTAHPVSAQQTRVDRVGGIGQLKLGYVLFDNRQWLCYSSVGQGFSSVMLTVNSAGSKPVTWMLPSHTTDVSVHLHTLLARPRPADEKTAQGLGLGLHLGYVISARSSLWQQIPDGNLLQLKPTYAMNGFYVTLTIGGSRFQYSHHP